MQTAFKIFDDVVELDDFARSIKRHPRTVKRWMAEPDGLPFTWLGQTKLVHLPTAREWLLGRMKQANPRRQSHRK